MSLFPEPLRKALAEGSIKAADVLHWPDIERWQVCAQVESAASASRDYPGKVSYRLFRNEAGCYVPAGHGEMDQWAFSEGVTNGRLFS